MPLFPSRPAHAGAWWPRLVLLLACCLWHATSWAQNFPSRPLRIIVPFGAGGVADLTARAVATRLAESLGQSVVVENRPGAGGVAAGDAVAKAEPDGHTLLLMSNGTAVSANLFRTLPFDTVRDFTPVATLAQFDIAILVAADSKLRTLSDLLAQARAQPGKLNIGTINIGSTQHLVGELLQAAAGIDVQTVPFNGTPAVVQALRGGQIDAAVEILGPVMGQVQGKALRVLAVTGAARSPSLPEVPTAAESGVAGLLAASWNALAVPARTPPAVVARLHRDVQAALQSPELRRQLRELHVEPYPGTSAQAAELLASEIRRWGEAVRRAKIPQQ